MFTISKEFHFEASHELRDMPEGHPCRRNHGHSYRLRVTLACNDADLDDLGMVLDYHEFAPIKELVDTQLDHRLLNDVFPGLSNPTAERMCKSLYAAVVSRLKAPEGTPWWVHEVALSETQKTWATYSPWDHAR